MPTATTKALGVAYCQTLASTDNLTLPIAQRYAKNSSMAELDTIRLFITLMPSLHPACMMVVKREQA